MFENWFKVEKNISEHSTDKEKEIAAKEMADLEGVIKDTVGEHEEKYANNEIIMMKTQAVKDLIADLDTAFHVQLDTKGQPGQSYEKMKLNFMQAITELVQKLKTFSDFDPSIQLEVMKFEGISSTVTKFLGAVRTEKDINTTMGMMWDENSKVLFNSLTEIETALHDSKPQEEINLN